MNGEKSRQLAAIMFTDIVGYSRLTQKNEAHALDLLRVHQRLIRSVFRKYGGSEIKTMGDAFLLKFPSAVEATRCAVEIQKAVVEYGASTQRPNRYQIRIGIHLGDIVPRHNDVYGDGVNIASRIEPLAEPGGVCLTQQVYDQIQNKISEPVVRLGVKELKNIRTPVGIYKIVLPWQEERRSSSRRILALLKRRRVPLIFSAIVLVAAGWWFLWPPFDKESITEKQSIAVLPFQNLSDTKEDEYFSDGITGDILTRISKIGDLNVIAWTSVMRYKRLNKGLVNIGEELGVTAVLEGSVRRSGGKVRIVAQLVDADNEEYLWSETYESDMAQIFAIQSEIAQKIAVALKARLSPTERSSIDKKPTENLEAYTYYLRGRDYYFSRKNRDNESAVEFFKKAVAIDSSFALAYAGLGEAYCDRVELFGLQADWADSAVKVATKSIVLDPNLSEVHAALARAYVLKEWYSQALAASRRALQLNPNDVDALGSVAWVKMYLGDLTESFQWMKNILILRPAEAFSHYGLGEIFRRVGDYPRARQRLNKALEIHADFIDALSSVGFLHLMQGEHERALKISERILSINPDNVTGIVLAAYTELVRNNLGRAAELYQKALSLKPRGRNWYTGRHLQTELGYIYARGGQADRAELLLGESSELNGKQIQEGSGDHRAPFDLLTISSLKRQTAEAHTWLQKAIEAGWRDYHIVSIDPLLENLRKDEKFAQRILDVKKLVDTMRDNVEGMDD